MIRAANEAANLGVSVVPVDPTTKQSIVKWKELQERIYTAEEISQVFKEEAAIAFICGAISGYLECIDFDIPKFFTEFEKECRAKGVGELFDKLIKQHTPSGGFHVIYRCPEGIDENLKLAWSPTKNGKEIAIETRGEGGYFLACPSTGYMILEDSPRWKSIPNITAEERGILLSICVSLSECPYEEHRPHGGHPSIKRPSDKYNEIASWDEILFEHGWTQSKHLAGGRLGWVRPGKDKRKGIGATTGNIGSSGDDLLYVHTSNAPKLKAGTCYSKFSAMVELKFGGDFYMGVNYARDRCGLKHRNDNPYAAPKASSPETFEQRESQFIKLSTVKGKSVDWLFKDRFAKGMLSLLHGDPGEGKSTIARALTTMLTTGQAPSFMGMNIDGPRNVIWLTKEESLEYSVVPVLERMGADLDRVYALSIELDEDGKIPPDFIFNDWGIQQLRELIEATEAALIIIDPLPSFFDASTDMHRQNETRTILNRLIQMGAQTGAVPLGIVHQSKAKNSNALLNILGSVDFGAAARTTFLVGHDPDDRDKKGFVPTKNNLGPFADAVGFSIGEDGQVLWDEHSGLSADRLNEPPSVKAKKEKTDACAEWLRNELDLGKHEVNALLARAREQGFCKSLVYECANEQRVSRGNQPTTGRGRGPAWWAKAGYRWEEHEWPDPFA